MFFFFLCVTLLVPYILSRLLQGEAMGFLDLELHPHPPPTKSTEEDDILDGYFLLNFFFSLLFFNFFFFFFFFFFRALQGEAMGFLGLTPQSDRKKFNLSCEGTEWLVFFYRRFIIFVSFLFLFSKEFTRGSDGIFEFFRNR